MTFIVSTGAYRASVNFGAYSASKAGVVMMKTLALELAPWESGKRHCAYRHRDAVYGGLLPGESGGEGSG